MIELSVMADELGADKMPTIEQISNYLKYRRLKLGNSYIMQILMVLKILLKITRIIQIMILISYLYLVSI